MGGFEETMTINLDPRTVDAEEPTVASFTGTRTAPANADVAMDRDGRTHCQMPWDGGSDYNSCGGRNVLMIRFEMADAPISYISEAEITDYMWSSTDSSSGDGTSTNALLQAS